MITYIESAADVIACSVRGGFTASELGVLVSKLEQKLDANAKTHMFFEIDGLDDIDWYAIAEHLPQGFRLIRQLERFGRIAVVSDDRWVRLWTRTESALLPNISYELFRARERDRAFDWTQGRAEMPHAPALTIIPTEDQSVLAYDIDGNVTAADMDKAVAEFGPRLRRANGPVRGFARVGELDFPSFSALLKKRYFDLKIETLGRLERYAIVGGPKWLQKAALVAAPLLAFEIRCFEPTQKEEAWQWIGASPATRGMSTAAPALAVA